MAPLPAWGRVPISTLPGPGWRSPKGRWERGEFSRLVSAKKPSRAPGQVRVGGGGLPVRNAVCSVWPAVPRQLSPFGSGRKAKHHGRVSAKGVPGASLVGRALLVTSGCGGESRSLHFSHTVFSWMFLFVLNLREKSASTPGGSIRRMLRARSVHFKP